MIIYDAGCVKCRQVEQVVRTVIEQQGVDVELTKVTDLIAIAAAGVLGAPAVSIDGAVKAAGRVPSHDEVARWFAEVPR